MDKTIGTLYQERIATRRELRRIGKRFDPVAIGQGKLSWMLNSGEIEATLALVLKFRDSNSQMLRELRNRSVQNVC
jgi:hypothetical protein